MVKLKYTGLLVGQPQTIAPLVQILHTTKQFGIEHDVRLMRGKLRYYFAFNALQLFIRIGAGQIKKDAAYAIERTAALFKCRYRVSERRPSRLCHNYRYLFFVRSNRSLERLRKVARRYLVKRWHPEWCRPSGKKWICDRDSPPLFAGSL
jgi:hypothetical protein